MPLGMVDQDKSSSHLRNWDGTIEGFRPLGDKPQQVINSLAVHIDPNAVDDPSRSGAAGDAFKTRQFAMANKAEGLDHHYYLRGGVHTDYSAGPITGWQGTEVSISGTEQKPVLFENFPGEHAIIDLQNLAAAFNIMRSSWVKILGLEIRQCYGSAIYTGADGGSPNCTDILVERCWIHGIDGAGGTNVGGIRFDDCIRGTALLNLIHNIRVGGSNNGNAACIHGYRMEDMLLVANTLFDAYNGIFHKLSTGNIGLLVLRNLIHNCFQGIYYDVQGQGSPTHKNQRVLQNIFYLNDSDIYLNAADAAGQNDGLTIGNNTFGSVIKGIGYEDNTINIDVYNNIFFPGLIDRALMYESETMASLLSNYNFFAPGADRFQIDRFEAGDLTYNSLASWQAAQNRDQNSTVGDPLFIDAANRNYRLQAGSPARTAGRGGINPLICGAYVNDNDQIGSNHQWQ